jgi:hypothetical protein
MEDRKNFHRRRQFFEDEDVSYISEKNRAFNERMKKHIKKHGTSSST